MCAQCAMLAASAATGARSWIASRQFSWMTPRRLKRVTIALFTAALIASTVRINGSTPHDAHPTGAVAHPAVTASAGAGAHARP